MFDTGTAQPAGWTRDRHRVPAWRLARHHAPAPPSPHPPGVGRRGRRLRGPDRGRRLPGHPGVLIVPLQKEFGWSRAQISLAVTVNLLLFGLTAPFAATLMDRYGMRRVVTIVLLLVAGGSTMTIFMTARWQLVLGWGVLVGFGTGSMALVFAATVAKRPRSSRSPRWRSFRWFCSCCGTDPPTSACCPSAAGRRTSASRTGRCRHPAGPWRRRHPAGPWRRSRPAGPWRRSRSRAASRRRVDDGGQDPGVLVRGRRFSPSAAPAPTG